MAAKILAIGMIGLMLLVALGGCLDGGDDGTGPDDGGDNGGQIGALQNPTGVIITEVEDGSLTIEWNPVSGATSYNIYWTDDIVSVGTPAYGEKIAGVSSPYTHTGLTNGATYFYIVTSAKGGDESDKYDASEVAATPPGPQNGGPIRIQSDDHFTTANGVTGGAGTKANPYMIRGWTIDASSSDTSSWPYIKTAIAIHETSKYFIITNCTGLSDGGYGTGISLTFVENGKIQDCTFSNTGAGISFSGCSNIEISGNAIENCDDGISSGSYSSEGITMSDNTITGCADAGIEFHYLENSTASGNTITNGGNGIYVSGIWFGGCAISGNTIRGNLYTGIEISSDSSNCTISGNDVSDNDWGIGVYGAYNKILNNAASSNDWWGIRLDYTALTDATASHNTISGNTASGNGADGILVGSNCIHNTISNNVCQSNNAQGEYYYDGTPWYYDINIESQPNTLSGNTYGTSHFAS
jgi:parallel beta-helix repeat protein